MERGPEAILVVNKRATYFKAGTECAVKRQLDRAGVETKKLICTGEEKFGDNLISAVKAGGGDEQNVIVLGGDGTVRGVVEIMLKEDLLDRVRLIHGTLGGLNVYGRDYGVNVANIAEAVMRGKLRKVDVLKAEAANGSKTILSAAGLIALGLINTPVIAEAYELQRRRPGMLGYWHRAVSAVWSTRTKWQVREVEIATDEGQGFSGKTAAAEVLNGPNFLIFSVTNNPIDSGKMTAMAVEAGDAHEGMRRMVWAMMEGWLKTFKTRRTPGIWKSQCRELTVAVKDGAVRVHADAEVWPVKIDTLTVKCLPQKAIFKIAGPDCRGRNR